MQQKSEMQQGWDFATQIMGADLAARLGMEYVSAVDAAIKQLEENINNHNYRNLGIKQLQGFMLEEWGAGTFNVDAIAADSTYRAEVLHSTVKEVSSGRLRTEIFLLAGQEKPTAIRQLGEWIGNEGLIGGLVV